MIRRVYLALWSTVDVFLGLKAVAYCVRYVGYSWEYNSLSNLLISRGRSTYIRIRHVDEFNLND